MNQNIKNFLLLFLLASCWGPSFLFMKVAVEYIPPITITCTRLLIGSTLLFAILKFKKIFLPRPQKNWIHLFIAGLFQSAVPFTLFAAGEKYVDSGIAAIISGISPLFTLFLAHFFAENDKITYRKLIGSMVGFAGLLILVFPILLTSKASFVGVLMITAAAMCYSIGFVYTRKHVRGFAPMIAPVIQLFLGFLFLLPFSLLVDKPFNIAYVSTPAALSVLCLGVIGTATAFVLYYKVLEATSASYISMVNYITPVLGAILGMVVLGETMSWNAYLGSIMIISGVLVANNLLKINLKK